MYCHRAVVAHLAVVVMHRKEAAAEHSFLHKDSVHRVVDLPHKDSAHRIVDHRETAHNVAVHKDFSKLSLRCLSPSD